MYALFRQGIYHNIVQMEERHNQACVDTGSSPVVVVFIWCKYRGVVAVGSSSDSYSEGRGFKSHLRYHNWGMRLRTYTYLNQETGLVFIMDYRRVVGVRMGN